MPRPTRTKFLRLMTGLREAAKAEGESALADAANECLRNATTNPQCPVGRLLLGERPPRSRSRSATPAASAPESRPAIPPDFIARHSSADIVESLHTLLKSESLLLADFPMLQALRQCNQFMHATEPNICPFRRLLQASSTSSPPARKSP